MTAPHALLILLAEDCALIAEPLEMRLMGLGHTVICATDGAAALAAAISARPDVAIVDLGLPKMDGLSVVRSLKADPDFAAIPVVTMSAGIWSHDQPASLAAGAAHHLQKPFPFAALLSAVEGLCRSAHAAGETV